MKLIALTFVFTLVGFVIFGQAHTSTRMKMPIDIKHRIETFVKKEKFKADSNYPGLQSGDLKQGYTALINLAANDFLKVALSNPTEEKFQEMIKNGLNRFSTKYPYIDSEDEDRICHYFKELMEIVELQSSGGQLNMWRYGFDPSPKQ